jgi:signal peptidase I
MSDRSPGSADEPADAQPDSKGSLAGLLKELPVLIVVALVLATLMKTFLVQAFYIPSESMVPTLKVGDRVLVNRLVYRFRDIGRSDIVVFSDPNPLPHPEQSMIGGALHWLGEGFGLAKPPDEDFIKRVIGLPGETVEMRNGHVFVDGVRLDEPYLEGPSDSRPFGPVTVPAGQLFVLGDNRLNSCDSRFAPTDFHSCPEGGLGYVPIDNVIGEAFAIIWPPTDAGGL